MIYQAFWNVNTLPPSDEGGGFLQGKKTEGESKKSIQLKVFLSLSHLTVTAPVLPSMTA